MLQQHADDSGREQTENYRFRGMSLRKAESISGLETYLNKYGDGHLDEGRILEKRREECKDWKLLVECGTQSWELLCCPEDHVCHRKTYMSEKKCCPECWLPGCYECQIGMRNKHDSCTLPPIALANDLMVYYAPSILYKEEVTMMDMLCASVCLTSMICFSFEKYRGEHTFYTQVHMNNHRMGARGNVTSFPLPWQELLCQLKEVANEQIPVALSVVDGLAPLYVCHLRRLVHSVSRS